MASKEPIYLTIQRQGHSITMDLPELGPIVPRGQVSIEADFLSDINQELARLTTLVNKRLALGTVDTTLLADPAVASDRALQQLGSLIFSHLFPAAIRQRLTGLAPAELFLRLDDQLVHVPWELAFDGQDFLLNRFRIGRQVLTRQRLMPPYTPGRQDSEGLKMLIIADPTESLPAAAREAEQLSTLLATCEGLEVSIISGRRIRKIDLLQALNEYDLVHYAGHACFDPEQPERSGWVLNDAILTASELSRVPRPPLLVFANACQAGATLPWPSAPAYEDRAFGIGSAFLLAGTQNYIGTFCVIHDTHSAAFAADVYRHFLHGVCLGDALAAARQTARQTSAQSGLLWASYMHYGNPAFSLPRIPGGAAAGSENTRHGVVSHPVASGPAAADPDAPQPGSQIVDRVAKDAGNFEKILREINDLDRHLQETYRREVSIMFTDIKGSTAYYEQHGDLSGRLMVQRHNDLLFPMVTQHRGVVVETIGDAILATFEQPANAVQAAIAMQRVLRDENQGQEASKQIHIRIGINSGQALVQEHGISGDAVNVAARVESHALPDQILISEGTYQGLPDTTPCRPLGTARFKGKTDPIMLYEVHWEPDKPITATPVRRGPGIRPQTVFVLDVERQAARLKISAYERQPGEEKTIRSYVYHNVDFDTVQQSVDMMMALLNSATNRHGVLEASDRQALEAVSRKLYDQLLPAAVQSALDASTAADLVLYLDDKLVQIPWELLFDGQTFLCYRFNMGRIVSTQQEIAGSRERVPGAQLHMLIVADPQGNLESAKREGDTIQTELTSTSHRIQVEVKKTHVKASDIQPVLPHYDVLHYAGHADYDIREPAHSGWLLADRKLDSTHIQELGKKGAMPRLVFCNACETGQTAEWQIHQAAEQEIYGLAHAFLLAGVQHYIGTFWEVPDQPSSTFAIQFYQELAQGESVGGALSRARRALLEPNGQTNMVGASYVLYGDPTSCYLDATQGTPAPAEATAPQEPVRNAEMSRQPKRPAHWLVGTCALIVLLACVAVLMLAWPAKKEPANASPLRRAYQALEQGNRQQAETLFQRLVESATPQEQSQGYTGLAAAALGRNDYRQALDFARRAETLDPERAYSHVVRGHILVNQEKLTEAAAEYRTATQKSHALPWQHAIAYNRLGRLYAEQGNSHEALQQYDHALKQNGNMAAVYANKAHLLDKLGRRQEALDLYRQALGINPDDALTLTLLHETERRQQLDRNRDRRRNVHKLVQELVQAYQNGGRNGPAGDGWTSQPLTIALLDFRNFGRLSTRAGETEFIVFKMTHALRSNKRVTLVEREVLEEVLSELKLSVSDVMDSRRALRQGRILAARLLAAGSITRSGDAALVSINLIETETSRVYASVAEDFDMPTKVSGIVDQVYKSLMREIRRAYPLRGRIDRITPQGVILNIGVQQGVEQGLIMQVFSHETPSGIEGKVLPTPIGRIEVVQVDVAAARARVLEQVAPFEPGSKVEEIREK